MKILFVGDDWLGSNARSLANGFSLIGHEVVVVDTSEATIPTKLSPPWLYSKVRHQTSPRVIERIHYQIDRAAEAFAPDVLFCFKSIHLDQHRLLATPARLRVHYSPDDASNRNNLTEAYLASEAGWDLIVTTKRHNVDELTARGARAVAFVMSAYDPAWHHRSARRPVEQHDVGFVGAYRPDRRDHMVALAEQFGSRMAVYGPGWRRVVALRSTGATVGGPVYGEDFSATVGSIRANLVLLNSDNRDTHTCRTFEVPAAGGLFVGQRTEEHQALLDEGTECLLFSSEEELLDVLRWCDGNREKAKSIAEAGRRRISTGRHRYQDRAGEILSRLDLGTSG